MRPRSNSALPLHLTVNNQISQVQIALAKSLVVKTFLLNCLALEAHLLLRRRGYDFIPGNVRTKIMRIVDQEKFLIWNISASRTFLKPEPELGDLP